MKKKMLIILFGSIIVSLLLCGCSGQGGTQSYCDERFLLDLSKGLVAQFECVKEENESEQDYDLRLVEAQMDLISQYEDKVFEDAELQEWARAYIQALKKQKEALSFYADDYRKSEAAWMEARNAQVMIINEIIENYGFTMQNRYSEALSAFVTMEEDNDNEIAPPAESETPAQPKDYTTQFTGENNIGCCPFIYYINLLAFYGDGCFQEKGNPIQTGVYDFSGHDHGLIFFIELANAGRSIAIDKNGTVFLPNDYYLYIYDNGNRPDPIGEIADFKIHEDSSSTLGYGCSFTVIFNDGQASVRFTENGNDGIVDQDGESWEMILQQA